MNNVLAMLAAQVPMIEGRSAQVIFQRMLQPLAAEPESWKKARQPFAPKATIEGGVGILEISRVLAYRPDLGSLFFRDITDQDDELQIENAEPLVDNIITAGQMKAVACNRVDQEFGHRVLGSTVRRRPGRRDRCSDDPTPAQATPEDAPGHDPGLFWIGRCGGGQRAAQTGSGRRLR